MYFQAGGHRYCISLGRMMLLKRANVQDSFALEGSFFASKLINFPDGENGTYVVLPLLATARYNIHFGETFGIFFYAGVEQNLVPQAIDGTVSTLHSLEIPTPAVGSGFFFRVGPSWYTRIDLGLDSITLGLTLRF
jgi:hypothetical protein